MFGLSRLWTAAIAAGALLAAISGAWLYVGHLKQEAAQARAERDAAKAQALVTAAQATAGAEAAKIADAGRARDTTIIIREGEHRAQILAAPGAGAPVDPALYDALARGMCGYAVTADPRCAGLRQPDPADIPQAGAGREPARPDGR